MKQPRYPTKTILAVARVTHGNALQHIDRLALFGITPAFLDAFDSQIEAADAVHTLDQKRVHLREMTIEKEEVLGAVVDWAVDLRMRLQFAYGQNSALAKLFPARAFNAARNSEAAMNEVFDAVLQLARDHATQLAPFGQDETVLADGETLHEALKQADAEQEAEKQTGKSTTRERWAALNQLIHDINRINQTGRRVFRDDPTRHVLFTTKWPRRATGSLEQDIPEEEIEDEEAVA